MFASAIALLAFTAAVTQNSPPLAPRLPDAPAEALHIAVRAGRLEDVKRLLAAGTPADARDALGSTPLLDAAWSGDIEIAKCLLDHGADVNAHHRESGSTPLQYAVLTGRTEMTKLLLSAHASVSGEYRDGQSLLHVAAVRGYAPIIDLLVQAGANVQALDANGNTPLDSAVLHDQPFAFAALLRAHADVTYVHPLDGRGALHEACMRGYVDMLQPLIEAGADPTARDRFGQTPLDIALAYKNGNVVAALLRSGHKLKESQQIAEETMESATLRGQTEIARILLDNGLDVNRPSAKGAIYLNDAALKGQKKMVQLLLDHGALVTSRNQSGGTALHDAALGGNADVVALLLDHGAAIDDRELESGATPLMMAASMGRADVITLLLQRGADRSLKDKAGHTALERARSTEDAAIIHLLLQNAPEKAH